MDQPEATWSDWLRRLLKEIFDLPEVTGSDHLDVVCIARCAEHGLHGRRQECFICGKRVEQVPVVLLENFEKARERIAFQLSKWQAGLLNEEFAQERWDNMNRAHRAGFLRRADQVIELMLGAPKS